jgi:hypothetical protein
MIRQEVALAADIFMRLTLQEFLSMMCAVAVRITIIKNAVGHAPRLRKADYANASSGTSSGLFRNSESVGSSPMLFISQV